MKFEKVLCFAHFPHIEGYVINYVGDVLEPVNLINSITFQEKANFSLLKIVQFHSLYNFDYFLNKLGLKLSSS